MSIRHEKQVMENPDFQNFYSPLSEASKGYVFTGICLFTGGSAPWQTPPKEGRPPTPGRQIPQEARPLSPLQSSARTPIPNTVR